MVALLYHPYRFDGRVETALRAVSVLLEELYEMKGMKVDQGDRKGARGLQAGAAISWPRASYLAVMGVGRKEKIVTDPLVGECPKGQPMRDIESPAQPRGEGVTASIRRPREETARLGKEIYERDIRRRVEVDHHGEIVAIDVDSGPWVVAGGEIAAVDRLRNMRPGAVNVLCERVGYLALRSFGAGSLSGGRGVTEGC